MILLGFQIHLANPVQLYLGIFSRAFDSVDWVFVFCALRKFDYRNEFIHMIQGAYTNIQSNIKVNGLLSGLFPLMRRVHHGWPLSVLLYIIVAEVLAICTDTDTRIKGIQMGDYEIKIVNIADDTTIFVRDISCLTRIELILNYIKQLLGQKFTFKKPGLMSWDI